MPPQGYRMADKQSKKAIAWLNWMEKKVLRKKICHSGNYRETRLRENILVDGFIPPADNETHNGTVLQFYGCFWHACEKCHRLNRDKKMRTGDTMDSRFERTIAVSAKIKKYGYKLIEKWECDFTREINENSDLSKFLSENSNVFSVHILKPRDAFFGGRTCNNVKIYDCKDGEKVKYFDVCSLYPFICKRGTFPKGHPQIFVGEQSCDEFMDGNINKVNGLIECDVLPPGDLYHPVLPVRMHGKLIFPLCRTCCELMNQSECTHKDSERVLHGTWVSEEVKKAVQMNYKITKVYEIWQYDMIRYDQENQRDGMFNQYIDAFFIQKIYSSGFPPNCTTEEDKDRYVQDLKRFEGIEVEKDRIKHNPGLRSVSKLSLNSFWVKIFLYSIFLLAKIFF